MFVDEINKISRRSIISGNQRKKKKSNKIKFLERIKLKEKQSIVGKHLGISSSSRRKILKIGKWLRCRDKLAHKM